MSATWAEKECGQKKKHAMHWRMSIMANEFNFDEVWKPIKSVIDHCSLDYAEAVTLGGQFGEMKSEIKRLQQQNKRYREAIRSARDELGRQSGTSEIPTNITLKGAYVVYEILQKALEENQ